LVLAIAGANGGLIYCIIARRRCLYARIKTRPRQAANPEHFTAREVAPPATESQP
jgi:hypothetical protein